MEENICERVERADCGKPLWVRSGVADRVSIKQPERKMNCILVIEDEFDIQELLKNYLEEDGYQVLCASDGVQAVNLFEKKKENFITSFTFYRLDLPNNETGVLKALIRSIKRKLATYPFSLSLRQ